MDGNPTLQAVRLEARDVIVRKAREGDREGFVKVFTDPEVRAYLGGAKPRADVERFLDAAGVANLTNASGAYVVADRATDRFLGMASLCRRPADQPGHVVHGGEELELSYVLRRDAWGKGAAFQAAEAILRSAAAELPDQPVLVTTQTANEPSLKLAARLGFTVVGTFQAHGAEQTLATAPLSAFLG
ncbi:GNAT family N-acetyltransferase [Amycolatopsis sp. CA-230715]|uniref:GNAT family N-acetyltransferase n=1 Tax=Amycolatopsis sp. CA-230715 TaxID=2745196 RepID=UPI001C036F87|nr:GNAT family N-acetyltransferase [Amycolatopsis sp. CA-230715]QWF84253.1 hypothetical protein HUW46_07702 [Amycolatopsis sp. CA-230715]